LSASTTSTAPTGFATIPGVPELDDVMSPTITVADRVIAAIVADVDEREITLRFRPYQALRVTTVDCFDEPDGVPHRPSQIYWSRTSTWIDELTAALATVDFTADFMERAVHFIVPAGDDVIEVVAWRMELTLSGDTARSLPTG
jgi:hypothetical protein